MRLIDADELKEVMIDVLEHIKQNPKMDGQERHIIAAIATLSEMIDDAPTVDAVRVVRCKDCRFSDWYTAVNGKRYCYCMETGASGRGENDFCSYGERSGEHEAD